MSEPTEPTVYIVDDDVSVLRSVSRMLRASGYQVVIHNSATELLEELQPEMTGCLITDLMMPEMSGIELQDAIQASGNSIPIIFLTGHGDIPTSVRAMRSGAEDFLTKNAPKEDLIAAVDRALTQNARQHKEAAQLEELRHPFTLLSKREREVLQHVLQGQLNKQIAADLGIHERTVKLHRTQVTTKLGVHSVAELTRLAQQAGIFEEQSADVDIQR